MRGRATRVLLVGAYPPPPGGNSVHIERLHALLAPLFDVEVADLYAVEPRETDPPGVHRCRPRHPLDLMRAFRVLADPELDIVHVHVAAMNAFVVAGHAIVRTISRSARTILTIHSGSFVRTYAQADPVRRSLIRSLVRRFDRIVAVSDEQRLLIERLGVPAARIAVIPAFLPPLAALPPPELLALRVRSAKLAIASGYGLPYYGFATILDALDGFAPEERVGAAFFLYNSYDAGYVRELERRMKPPLRLLFRDLGAAQFAGALKRADVYVRATDRDGDAVAIREAAAAGVKVVASNAVPRPAGCELFRTGDAASLRFALERAWRDERAGRISADPHSADALLALYRDLAAHEKRAIA
jgi:glycosyltransferase involved in cell wall biosynthesis